MKRISFSLFVFFFTTVYGQEEIGPIISYGTTSVDLKLNENTFDSTFVFATDTISLPVKDDFSSDKYQNYEGDFSDPDVTSDEVFALLNLSDVPLASDVKYTQQQTFRRTFNVDDGTTTFDNFPAEQIQIGSLSSYPVVHTVEDVFPPFYIYDTIGYPNDSDTVWVEFPEVLQESATQFFTSISDPSKIWLEKLTHRNYNYPVDPWSLGVATFDGTDENGTPYAIGTSTSGYADYLTSKHIDMSNVNIGDSVYLSFTYQPEGFGDIPEPNDSLVLEFFDKNTDVWNRIWSTGGEANKDFELVHIKVDSAIYFTDGFQFRFKNYGALSGALDHFHLDYVNLRDFSGYQDTIIHDFAFVYPIYTLLKDFTSVPWDHYKNNSANKLSDSVSVKVRNSDNIPENERNGSVNVFYQGNQELSFVLDESLLNNGDLNYLPMTTYQSYHDFSALAGYDPTKIGTNETFEFVGEASHQNSSFLQNDSTYGQQVFKNYYSYDDGSAEAAYGPTGAQARLAIQYTPYQSDSVIGVRINFVPSVHDVTNKLFLLAVWDDNNGEPGDLIYEDEIFLPRSPAHGYGRDAFVTYYFKDTMKVAVDGTFYVGWRQFDANRLNVGLDRNIINNDKTFYSIDNEISWNVSGIEGSVMVHPIFSTTMDAELGIEEHNPASEVILYPNPTSGKVNIKVLSGSYNGVEVYNLQGRLITDTDTKEIDLIDAPKGVYLVKLKGSTKIYKIIRH